MKPNDASHDLLRAADELGHEARASSGDHAALRRWLRLLSCTTQIEAAIRRCLRARFDASLARLDSLAQLHRHRGGLEMRALARCLMVTGGSVTGLTDKLERDGLALRAESKGDRRAWLVKRTPKGQRLFETMAAAREGWVLELFAGLDAKAVQQVHGQLGQLRVHLVHNHRAIEETR